MENQRHSLLRLNGRPPEHGSKVTCANVEITSADVHTTDDVQTFLVDAKQSLGIMAVEPMQPVVLILPTPPELAADIWPMAKKSA